jgi:hypothetical protein
MKYVLSLESECCKDITNLCEEDDEMCFGASKQNVAKIYRGRMETYVLSPEIECCKDEDMCFEPQNRTECCK